MEGGLVGGDANLGDRAMNLQTAENLTAGLGHNSAGARVGIVVKMFNSITSYGRGEPFQRVDMPVGSTVGDVIRRFAIPPGAVHLVLVNGRDITPTLGAAVNEAHGIGDGDVVALSGPVPFSWGYGAAVV